MTKIDGKMLSFFFLLTDPIQEEENPNLRVSRLIHFISYSFIEGVCTSCS